ncbi:MAG: HNH endonuclease [Planctomycetes bacterium]|nr:HNH endonuclease [Planctomycetota bacterium]
MKKPKLPKDFMRKCKAIQAKRPKTVIEHILKKGYITTEELKELYGYNHPPRAARDVREQGIPLETFKVNSSSGRKIAAYKFGDPTKTRDLHGRTALTKNLKKQLIDKLGSKCSIYMDNFPETELQIDHRIPYEVAGEPSGQEEIDDYMLISPSANRAKSWSCEHCTNWTTLKRKSICSSCYWAFPENYQHVAMRQIRRLDLSWQGEETECYDKLQKEAHEARQDMPSFVKMILDRSIKK